MRLLTQKSVNYKGIVVAVVLAASVAAVVVEQILYRLSCETPETMFSLYRELIDVTAEDRKAFFYYLITNRMKQTLCLIVCGFTVAGLPIQMMMFFRKIYHYLFFVMVMHHNPDGSFILCLPLVLIWFLFCIPVYAWCIKTSLGSFRNCLKDGKGIHYSTKYQLQTDVKIGIIILVYVAFGAAFESIVCTYFLQAMF